MSLSDCVDALTIELQKPKKVKRTSDETQFIQELIVDFTKMLQEDNYQELNRYLTKIEEFSKDNQKKNSKYLDFIKKEITIIEQKRMANRPNVSSFDSKFRQYKIANIIQNRDFRLGSSLGCCLGFTYAMLYPDSPFKQINATNEKMSILFTPTVHIHQKNQLSRTSDQGIIKSIRHTGLRFTYNFEQQAKEIYLLAKKNENKDFYLKRYGTDSGHANYLSVRSNGEIWFMEPNCGAYVFTHEQQFIDFYQHLSYGYGRKNKAYFFYELRELMYDPNNQLKESYTWSGIVRSLLTGSKYKNDFDFISTNLHVGLAAGTFAAVVGAVLGGLAGSIVPVIGSAAGCYLGAIVGFSIGFAGSTVVFNDLNLNTCFKGFLAPLNMMRSLIAERRLKKELSALQKAPQTTEKNTFTMLLSELKHSPDTNDLMITRETQPPQNTPTVPIPGNHFWLKRKNDSETNNAFPLDVVMNK